MKLINNSKIQWKIWVTAQYARGRWEVTTSAVFTRRVSGSIVNLIILTAGWISNWISFRYLFPFLMDVLRLHAWTPCVYLYAWRATSLLRKYLHIDIHTRKLQLNNFVLIQAPSSQNIYSSHYQYSRTSEASGDTPIPSVS